MLGAPIGICLARLSRQPQSYGVILSVLRDRGYMVGICEITLVILLLSAWGGCGL